MLNILVLSNGSVVHSSEKNNLNSKKTDVSQLTDLGSIDIPDNDIPTILKDTCRHINQSLIMKETETV